MSADAALVNRCLSGDQAAARELVEQLQSDVLAVCRRLLSHAHDAEDVAQEVFLRVFRSLSRWDNTRPLRPWVLGIAVNRCRTWIGRRGKGPDVADYLHEVPDRRPTDDSAELVHEIHAAVDALRSEYREVFILFHEHGQPYEAIGMAMGRPVGTVKTWLHRARIEILDRLRVRGLATDESAAAPEPKTPLVPGE